MKKSELKVIKEFYDEMREAKEFYMNKSRNTNINSDEHSRAIKACSSITNDMNVIRGLLHRIGIDIS